MDIQKRRYNVVVVDSTEGMADSLYSTLQGAGAELVGSSFVSFYLKGYNGPVLGKNPDDSVRVFLERSEDIGLVCYKQKRLAASEIMGDYSGIDLVVVDDIQDPSYGWEKVLADIRKAGYGGRFVLANHSPDGVKVEKPKEVDDLWRVQSVDKLLRYIVTDFDQAKTRGNFE